MDNKNTNNTNNTNNSNKYIEDLIKLYPKWGAEYLRRQNNKN